MRHIEILVPGAPDVSDSLDITAPYDFSRIGSAELAGEKTVERALQTASELYRDKKNWIPLAERLEILENVAGRMQNNSEQ